MPQSEPVAFMSYVRSDDEHENGRITELRRRLEGEVRIQTGHAFSIFQDRNDIKWGQNWKERIDETILDVTFLIPIVTPTYFKSPACRWEFETFLLRERALGENRLILPIYYLYSDELSSDFPRDNDKIADVLRSRNWTDWRDYRFRSFSDLDTLAMLAKMAENIKSAMRDLQSIFTADRRKASAASPPAYKETKQPSHARGTRGSKIKDYNPIFPVVRHGALSRGALAAAQKEPYYVYTNKFDEIANPITLLKSDDVLQLNKLLNNLVRDLKLSMSEPIKRYVKQIRSTHPPSDISITILIDNSGSMRGSKIVHTAAWASMISEELEYAGVPFEILGYTTRAWKGGRTREMWIEDNKPERPGRLNDLRHIVYKAFSETSHESVLNLSAMLGEGLLKENIDGEALLWAFSRAKQNGYDRKAIFVISDGAPVDDSTLSVNSAHFLHKHLMMTARWISEQPGVILYATGLESDPSRYYPKSTTVTDAKGLGFEIFRLIPDLFT